MFVVIQVLKLGKRISAPHKGTKARQNENSRKRSQLKRESKIYRWFWNRGTASKIHILSLNVTNTKSNIIYKCFLFWLETVTKEKQIQKYDVHKFIFSNSLHPSMRFINKHIKCIHVWSILEVVCETVRVRVCVKRCLCNS